MIVLKHFLFLFLTWKTILCQRRIVGGHDTDIKDAPYMVSVQFGKGNAYCGGGILNRYTIVSAAHCLVFNTVHVRAGSTLAHSGGMYIRVNRTLKHPQHDLTKRIYDVGLIWLEQPLVYSNTIQPIEIVPAGHVTPPGTIAFVTGWGWLKDGGFDMPEILQGVEVSIIDQAVCTDYFKNYFTIASTMICAGYDVGGRDSCRYDSGGPLVVNGKAIAVVSTGKGCARPRLPGIYADLAHPQIRSWVYANLKPDPVP